MNLCRTKFYLNSVLAKYQDVMKKESNKFYTSKTTNRGTISTATTTNRGTISTTTPFPEFEDLPVKSHDDLYKLSLENPDLFWGRLAKSRLEWFRHFDIVQECDIINGKFKWFSNGQINVSGKFSLT